jgi:hypothetical protein
MSVIQMLGLSALSAQVHQRDASLFNIDVLTLVLPLACYQ